VTGEGALRVLWVAADVPHPPAYGKLVYSAGLSEALAGAGHDVAGLALAGEPPVGAVRWRSVGSARRARRGALASPLPSLAYATAAPALRQAVREALRDRRWDAVVVDHLETGWVLDDVPADAVAVAYVAHNHEASARAEIARGTRQGRLRRLALRLDARRAARLEGRLVARADLVTAITAADATRFARDGARRVVTLTPGYDGPRAEQRVLDESVPRRATIVTSLDWHAKRENLDLFLRAADPVFAAAGVELLVVGAAPAEYLRERASSCAATVFAGHVDSLAPVLAASRIGIVAEPLGGGFKMKALDFVFQRVPIAALEGSLAGVPLHAGDDHLTFPDVGRLARGVVSAIDDLATLNRLHERAYRACAAQFDWADRGARFAEALRERLRTRAG
jgi:glycosyltransferase involved in cell wall biosynthesis